MKQETTKFDPKNKEHKMICVAAMLAADQFGAGRVQAAKEQLQIADIIPYQTTAEQDIFQRAIFEWGDKF